MRLHEFKKCLSSLEDTGAYLLWGNETFFIDRIISRLKSLLFRTDEARTANCIVFYAPDCQASEVVAASSTHPFFGEKSLVIVHNVSDFPKADLEVINTYLSSQTPAAVLVLADPTPHRYPMPQHPAVPKGKARVIDVSSPPDQEFDRWVRALLSRDKKTVSPGALESLHENVGNNITNLALEIEKLICVAGDEQEINETHISALLGRSKSESEFALADAVASGDKELALTLLADLLREGARIPRLIALIRSQLVRIWKAKEMLESGESGKAMCQQLRIPPKRLEDFLRAVNRFTVSDLGRALRLIMDAEIRSRTQKLDERTIAEMLLLGLCTR